MKKKYFIILFLCLPFFVGCSNDKNDIVSKLDKKISDLDKYRITGLLTISNNDDIYKYDVEVSYKEKDNYRVSLVNKSNDHEQIILKNKEGVFVVTPSLNKSFKFQSDWPYNNSQVYLLKSIVNDLERDKEIEEEVIDGGYIITSKVNFPNNPKLVKQKVTVDDNLMIKKVEILNNDGISLMTFTINNTNYKPMYDESFFQINSIINTSENNEEKKTASSEENSQKTSTIDDIIYPLYIPSGTVLTGEEKVSKTDGERVILTFGGEKPFTLVEETTKPQEEFTVVPTYGEPYLLIDTVGALSNNSINWVSNGIEYYIVSDVMNQTELIEVAKSVNTVSVLK